MGLDAISLYRLARWLHSRGVPALPRAIQKTILLLFRTYLPYEAALGEGTRLGYGGISVVLHKDTRVGEDCIISQGVTLGGRTGHSGVPHIGDRVFIGAGAKILGPVMVGDDAVIGANAVVLHDVPAGAVVAGVPAREIRRHRPPSGLRPGPAAHPSHLDAPFASGD